ncbi:MAG: hypothetical protein VX642_08055, partial [Bdellovibrionota bacterium]|nr:hypothetical protein [Bdellovibrionota bacterium]
CGIESLDLLKYNLNQLKLNRKKSQFVQSVFCEGNSGESPNSSLWKTRTEVMQYFNRCDGSSMGKSFIDTLANGIQASGCRPKHIEQSCRDNIVNQLIKVCEKIIGDYEKPIGMGDKIITDRVSSYINTCRNGAIKALDLFHGYQSKDHRTFLGLINLKDTLQRECVHNEINQSKEIIKAAILNLDQELVPLLSAHINTDSFEEKKKTCSFLSEKAKSLMDSKSNNVNPETKLSYKQILDNLPKPNSRPSKWTPSESAAYVLFNENALTIKEEIQFCNSGNGRNKSTNRFGKTN